MNRIKELREAAKMTQAQLGAKIQVGNTAVSMYESGSRQLDPDTICKICDIFGCTADYLLGRSEFQNPVISNADAALLRAYHAASLRDQHLIDEILQAYAEAEDTSKSAG